MCVVWWSMRAPCSALQCLGPGLPCTVAALGGLGRGRGRGKGAHARVPHDGWRLLARGVVRC